MAADPLGALPLVPADATGPVFNELWEAQAFVLVVAVHQARHFIWTEWVETISGEIRQVQAAGDPDLGNPYYCHWLAVLEKKSSWPEVCRGR